MKAAASAAKFLDNWDDEGEEGEAIEKDTENVEDVKMAEALDGSPVSSVS